MHRASSHLQAALWLLLFQGPRRPVARRFNPCAALGKVRLHHGQSVYRHQASGMTALRHRTNKWQRRQHCKPFPTCKFLRAWAEEVVFVRIHTPCPRDGFMKVHCPDGTEQSGSASVRTSHFLRQMPEAVDNFTPSSLSFCIPFRQAIL